MLKTVQNVGFRGVIKQSPKPAVASVTKISKRERISRSVHLFALKSYQRAMKMKNQNLSFTRLMLKMN